jgi:hypothetical protein
LVDGSRPLPKDDLTFFPRTGVSGRRGPRRDGPVEWNGHNTGAVNAGAGFVGLVGWVVRFEDVEDHGIGHALSYPPRFVAGGTGAALAVSPAAWAVSKPP